MLGLIDLRLISIVVALIASAISSIVILFHTIYYWIGRCDSNSSNYFAHFNFKFHFKPKVSVIIPIKSEPLDVLGRILHSLSNQSYPINRIEVLVVSDDEESYFRRIEEFVYSMFGDRLDVKVYRREKPYGFKAGALNYALKRCSGKYVFVFDVDAVPEEAFIEKVVSYLESNPDVAGLATKWVSHNGDSSPVAEAQAVSLEFLTTIFFGGKSKSGSPIIIPGSGCAFRRSALERIGGWNESFIAEDIELSVRFILNGLKLSFLNGATVQVENPETYEAFKKQQARWIYGSAQVLLKYFHRILFSRAISWHWKFDLILYLLQYHVLLANFMFAGLALVSLIAGFDMMIPTVYFSPLLLFLLFLQAYSYYDVARRMGLNFFRSFVIMGRCTAMAAVLAPLVFIQSLKLLLNLGEKWYVTPKGSLAKSIRSSSVGELLIGSLGLTMSLLLFAFGFPFSAFCLFTLSLPYIYVSWKVSRGIW